MTSSISVTISQEMYANEQSEHITVIVNDCNGADNISPIITLTSTGIDYARFGSGIVPRFTKIGVGLYEIANVPPLAKSGWYISTPKDHNNNVYFMLEYEEVLLESKLIIKTYTPEYLWLGRVSNGASVDIPSSMSVSIRFHKEG